MSWLSRQDAEVAGGGERAERGGDESRELWKGGGRLIHKSKGRYMMDSQEKGALQGRVIEGERCLYNIYVHSTRCTFTVNAKQPTFAAQRRVRSVHETLLMLQHRWASTSILMSAISDIRHQHLLFRYRRKICRTENCHSDIGRVPMFTS